MTSPAVRPPLSYKVRKLLRILRHPVYRGAFRQGVRASVEHAPVRFGYDFATIVDVGASRGQFAAFARGRFPRAAILCFEPLSEQREVLSRALGDGERVRVLDYALSDSSGERTFHVARSPTASSLLPITERQAATFEATDEVRQERVPTERLDAVLTSAEIHGPALLKIDVQGAELDVLRGADRVVDSFDEIFVECTFVELYEGQALADDVVAYLRERDFRLVGLWSMWHDDQGACIQADFLFRRG